MMCNFESESPRRCAWILLVIAAVAFASLTAQTTETTQITIDGLGEDWAERRATAYDRETDGVDGYLNFAKCYAFLNQHALYFLCEVTDPEASFVQLDIFVEIGSHRFLYSWCRGDTAAQCADISEDFVSIGPTSYSSFALQEALEVRLDLRDLPIEYPGYMNLLEIAAMKGDSDATWRRADTVTVYSIPLVDEVDPAWMVGSSLDYVMAREFQLPEGFLAECLYEPELAAPCHIAIGPSGQIVITEWSSGDQINELRENGTVVPYCDPPSYDNRGVAFDGEGNLYVSDVNCILWKIAPDGTTTQLATGFIGYQMDVDASGNIYATGGEGHVLQRATPDGQVSTVASGFSEAIELAVSPTTGDIFVYDMGAGVIYQVRPNGTKTVLVRGVQQEWNYIACSQDGRLFMMMDGLIEISTTTGEMTSIPWLRECYTNLFPADFAFDPHGRIVAVDITYNHVVRFDLPQQQMDVLWQGAGNTRALAVSPAGDVYMGITHPSRTGSGSVVRIDDGGNVATYLTDLLPDVTGLAFAPDGTAYVLATGEASGETATRLYAVDPLGQVAYVIALPSATWEGELAVDPVTGNVWGIGPSVLWTVDAGGHIETMSSTPAGRIVESLTFTPDGDLYLVAYPSEDSDTIPVEGALYRVDTITHQFEYVADLSTVLMCCPLGRIGGGYDGRIYWVGHGDLYTPDHVHDMHMLQIAPDGSVELFAQNLPMDPCAVTCDPGSLDLYFASGNGVFHICEVPE